MTDEEILLEQFQLEMLTLENSGAGVGPFVFRPNEAFMLLGLLQLALRHPNIASQSRAVDQFGRGLAENLAKRLGKDRPAMAEVARRGWSSEYDLKPKDS